MLFHTPEVIYTLASVMLIGGKGGDFIGLQEYKEKLVFMA